MGTRPQERLHVDRNREDLLVKSPWLSVLRTRIEYVGFTAWSVATAIRSSLPTR